MTALIERVRAERTDVDLIKAAGTVAVVPFVVVGWLVAKVFTVAAAVVSWVFAACLVGWTAGRT